MHLSSQAIIIFIFNNMQIFFHIYLLTTHIFWGEIQYRDVEVATPSAWYLEWLHEHFTCGRHEIALHCLRLEWIKPLQINAIFSYDRSETQHRLRGEGKAFSLKIISATIMNSILSF